VFPDELFTVYKGTRLDFDFAHDTAGQHVSGGPPGKWKALLPRLEFLTFSAVTKIKVVQGRGLEFRMIILRSVQWCRRRQRLRDSHSCSGMARALLTQEAFWSLDLHLHLAVFII
jgi:hypothetical protein